MADLSVNLGPLTLKNPFVAAGGPLAGTVDHIKHCIDSGLGAVVTKTASTVWYLQRYPRPLYRLLDYKKDRLRPYYVPDSYSWLHREHNSVYRPMQFAKIIAQCSDYAKEHSCTIIGSYSARTMKEWRDIAHAYEDAGSNAIELNFCCPFPPEGLTKDESDNHVGIYYTRNPEAAAEIVAALKKEIKIPLFAKLSPDGSRFEKIAKMLEEAGVAGVTMFANNKCLRVDIETGKPILYGPAPGTGPGLKALSIRWVSEIAEVCNIAVMGNRGASTWEDAVEYIMAGADAVQYCTPLMIRGLGYVQEMIDGLEGFMKRRGYNSISDFKDMALRQIYSNEDLVEKVKGLYAVVNYDRCMGCRRCEKVCWYDALSVGRKAVIKKKNCAGCSLCKEVCPVDAIYMDERVNDLEHFQALASAHPELAPKGFFPEMDAARGHSDA